MTSTPTVTLNDGNVMPQLGYGVFKIPQDETEIAVSAALDAGYRLIDTAAMYGNEEGVGAAIAKSDIDRTELFITTKLNNDAHGYDAALKAGEASLKRLGIEAIDLYLIHWPLPPRDLYVETWRALVRLQEDGIVRSIGVSNFEADHLIRIMDDSGVTPAVNQIELHPYLSQPALREFDTSRGIATEAWSPIARGGELLNDSLITSLADKYGRTPAQIVIRWHLDLGNVVIPKSVTPARIAENFDVLDFELTPPDLEAISTLNRDGRIGPNPATFNP